MHQFDVNNYILCKTEGGEVTNKGAKASGIAGPFSRGKVKLQKYDGRIIKQAIVAYLSKGMLSCSYVASVAISVATPIILGNFKWFYAPKTGVSRR